jgi:hypothetical protein
MTTKTEPAQPAGQDGTTVVLDAEALAQSQEVNEQTNETLEAVAAATADAPEAPPADAAQVASTTRRMQAVDAAQSEPPLLPSHMLPGGGANDPGATTQLPIPEAGPVAAPEAAPVAVTEPADAIADEVDPDWAVADQPTVQFTPPTMPPARKTDRPAFLETGEQEIWPPRPSPASTPVVPTERPPVAPFPPAAAATPVPQIDGQARPYSATRPRTLGQVQPNPIPRPVTRPNTYSGRLASPTGRQPLGSADAPYSDPRMRRLVELRLQRDAHSEGHRGPTDNMPVGQMVRQWWSDLLPGLSQALDHMHEARESGIYPIPAHEATPTARLGDAFGRLSRAARDLGGRAQAVAGPTINRLHDRAEHAAQALVDRIEGPPARQQAPLLGPGRLAVFFQQGVTVVQAQRLLVSNRARPMRLIPRRHGFLALVQPGQEPAVGEQLRQHPYVRDVVYLEYGDNGEPLPPR